MPKVKPAVVLGHMFATDDAQYPHTRFVDQSAKKLRCDQEVLTAPASPHLIVAFVVVGVGVGSGGGGVALGTGNIHQALMHHAFIARVHTLVDFVDDAEWRGGEGLERHEVEDGTNCSFATGLAVRVEEGEAFIFAELDVDLNRPLVEVTATRTSTNTTPPLLLPPPSPSVVSLGCWWCCGGSSVLSKETWPAHPMRANESEKASLILFTSASSFGSHLLRTSLIAWLYSASWVSKPLSLLRNFAICRSRSSNSLMMLSLPPCVSSKRAFSESISASSLSESWSVSVLSSSIKSGWF